jgi:hypothetical protein
MVKEFTAEAVFTAIDNQSVSKKDGISLIETYALRKVNEAVEALRKDLSISYEAEIEATIERINRGLDKLIETILP